ncbi:MAG: succinylglutamate desuccinylase/aspartoacylase family protein, partial [Cyanobacteria bacterium J06623_1]
MSDNIIEIAKETIKPGQLRRIELPVSRLVTQTLVSLPVTVVNGVESGSTLWLSAAIHGDELNGVEIIAQILGRIDPQKLRGTIIAVSIVNVFGFLEQSRYLPDRRDLNRSFPGSENGSLASQLADLFMREIVNRSDYGIDLHTGAVHRTNLPQIRANLEDETTLNCAKAFGASLMMHSTTRDGSLRHAATKKGIPVLLYEAGEALRFDPLAIKVGVAGIMGVMKHLQMYQDDLAPTVGESLRADKSRWIRASCGGIFHLLVNLGDRVSKKQELGYITNAFGEAKISVRAKIEGLVIGHVQNPLVNQGDAIVHIAIISTYS